MKKIAHFSQVFLHDLVHGSADNIFSCDQSRSSGTCIDSCAFYGHFPVDEEAKGVYDSLSYSLSIAPLLFLFILSIDTLQNLGLAG